VQAALPTCKTGAGYIPFEKNYPGVDIVCPAHSSNYSTSGMATSGPLYVVIHNTGNPYFNVLQGNINTFQKDNTGCDACKASAQYLVGYHTDGVLYVIQMVSENYRSFHVGANNIALDGVEINNHNSIGIEIVGQGDLDGWPTQELYTAVADLVKDIAQRAKAQGRTIELTRDYIVGHEEINNGGKFDPGPNWDWQLFMEGYLGGAYTPAYQATATRAANGNDVTLQVLARSSGRTGFNVERSEDEGPFHAILGPVSNSASGAGQNPLSVNLGTDRVGNLDMPSEYCYRVFGHRNNHNYVNPSNVACVVVGPPGTPSNHPRRDAAIVWQNEYPILKPGEATTLQFKLRNTGALSWKPDGRYVLINTGGERFGLQTQLLVSEHVLPYAKDVLWELPIVAPKETRAYTTRWQMAYIDPQTGSITLFGAEVGYVVTVLPGGNSSDLGQIIRQIIDEVLKTVTEPLEQFLADLQRRIEEEIDRRTPWWVKCWLSLVGPGVVISGLAVWGQRKRRR
jgi:N-acetyl-anhydromuramyl-L-alanine amidase AmpD